MTTLLLLMGCAGIGRSGKQDSVTFDLNTASIVSIDENEIFKNGDILLEPKVEIDAPEVVFSLRDISNLEGLIEIDPQTGVITAVAANGEVLTPDHEDQSEYTFTIVASFGSQESTQTIKVVINDLNDSPPIFGDIGPAAGSDTVVMRFNSDGDANGSWRMDDGGDVIHNFKRGEDKLVFVDMVDKTGASPITSLDNWVADDNRPVVNLVYDISDINNGNLGIKTLYINFGEGGRSTGPTSGSFEGGIIEVNFDPAGGYFNLTEANYATLTENDGNRLSDAGMALLTEILGGSDDHESIHVIDDADLPSALTIL